jgi:outer membrane protein OmpA-like peptidoglycan-associated protein
LSAGDDTEQNLILSAGIVWSSEQEGPEPIVAPAAAIPAEVAPVAVTQAVPEKVTQPAVDADTDRDGLTDREEVETYKTDPLNPDTDYDGLKDGEEALTHKTNPLLRDTDGGGVTDGHEAIEDHTQPLEKADDLEFYELQMTFDKDESDIKAEYVSDLDAIAKVLKADPGAQARIEGHMDLTAGAVTKDDLKQTQRRAEAVRDHFVKKCGVEKNRVEAVGYGSKRPKAANDPAAGNPVNRRMEIYIRRTPPTP